MTLRAALAKHGGVSARGRRIAIGIVALGAAAATGAACTCSKTPSGGEDAGSAAVASASASASVEPGASAEDAAGLSAPIAASRVENGDVVVAGLDVAAKAIRVQRLGPDGAVKKERTILAGAKWSSDAEMRVAQAGKGAAVTWHGLYNGRLVRELAVLDAELTPKGEPVEIAAASCATQDALWSTDGKRATARPWAGAAVRTALPQDGDVSLSCGAHRAFALVDEDDGTAVVVLGDKDAGAPLKLFEESAFGDDDQRERADYTVGDDVGVVRLASSGSLAVREVHAGERGPLHKLKTVLPRDADVVAVDATARQVVVVYTDDASDTCAEAGEPTSSTKVSALRIDRMSFEESTVELSPGMCGREVGPFFTGGLGDALAVAWVERVPVHGKTRAPIAGLAHRSVAPAGATLAPLGRIDLAADALVDAGCDGTHCFAVALARQKGMDAMVPGWAKLISYP